MLACAALAIAVKLNVEGKADRRQQRADAAAWWFSPASAKAMSFPGSSIGKAMRSL
jgi:hypothetical protein